MEARVRMLMVMLAAAACSRSGRDAGRPPRPRATLGLSSPAFADGAEIPARHAHAGCGPGAADVSPPLVFRGVPPAARSLALIVDDPDAPGGVFVHWVVYDLAPTKAALPAGLPPAVVGFQQGRSGFGTPGWGGPCPPSGEHRYVFRLYALDTPTLGLAVGATADEVRARMRDHVLAEGTWTGRYRHHE
jgi:Raf kinase inhibitor-like YbhB/YbcL family protein